MSDNVKLGYIGLGNMGAPMAKRLVDWPGGVTVFDVRTEAMTPLAEAGATLADSLADVAAADIISVTVLNDEQVRDVVGELAAHAKPGTVIAIHSTISPDTAVELAEQLRPQGIHIVDAPVSGGGGAAEKGELAVMVGADREVYERIKPAFKQLASLVIHAGEPGAGTRMKLARNMLTFTSLRRGVRGDEVGRGSRSSNLQHSGRVVRHSDAQSGGPGAIIVREDMTQLGPDHWLYDAFTHTRGLGEKDLSLALGYGRSGGHRPAAGRGGTARIWRQALACRTAHRPRRSSHGRIAQERPRQDERGLRVGDAERRRGRVLRR